MIYIIYHYNYHGCEYMCLNIAHPSETPYLSLIMLHFPIKQHRIDHD